MTNYSFEEWKKVASKINFRNKAFISGKFVEGFLKETIFAPISIGVGEFVGRAVNQKTQEITKDVGNTKASQRYQDLDKYMTLLKLYDRADILNDIV